MLAILNPKGVVVDATSPFFVLLIVIVPVVGEGGVGLLTTEHVGFGLVAETVTVQGLPVVIHPVVVSVMVYVPPEALNGTLVKVELPAVASGPIFTLKLAYPGILLVNENGVETDATGPFFTLFTVIVPVVGGGGGVKFSVLVKEHSGIMVIELTLTIQDGLGATHQPQAGGVVQANRLFSVIV